MEDKAVRGVRWTILKFAGPRGIGLVTMVVLARLLVPADFGLVAIGTIVVEFFTLFADFGLGHTLVLRQDLDRRAQGTILTLMIALGVTVAGLAFATAPLLATALGEPRAGDVIAVLAVILSFVGLSSFYDQLLRRELEFRRLFVASVLQSLVYATIAITLAALGAGVWSIVIGQAVSMAILSATLVALSPYRVRPTFHRGAAREAVSVGKGFLFQGGVAYLGKNADYIAIGRMLGTAPLGIYATAFRLAEVSFKTVTNPVAVVTFPGFSRMLRRKENVRPAFLSVLRLVALVACPIGVLLSAVADPFVRALFGEQWLAMIAPLTVLGIWAALRPLQNQTAWLLNAFGEQMRIAWTQAAVLAVTVPALFFAAALGGITAVAWVLVARVAVTLAIISGLAARRAGVAVKDQWRAVRAVVLASPFAWVGALGVTEVASGELAVGLVLPLSAVTGLGVYAGLVSLLEPGTLQYAAAQLRRIFARSPVAAPGA